MCYIFVFCSTIIAPLRIQFVGKRCFVVKACFFFEAKIPIQKTARQVTKTRACFALLMGQKNIDDDLMYGKQARRQASKQVVCLFEMFESKRRSKRQQKIARFECIQLFFSFYGELFKYDIINHPSGGFNSPWVSKFEIVKIDQSASTT